MNSSDREVVSSLLQAAGLHHPYARERRLNLGTKFDRHGKVTELTLGYSKVVENGRDDSSFWDLPDSIGELNNLRKLVLCHCQSLPPSICQLQHLEVLELHNCRGKHNFAPFPTDEKTTSITPLYFHLSLNWNIMKEHGIHNRWNIG